MQFNLNYKISRIAREAAHPVRALDIRARRRETAANLSRIAREAAHPVRALDNILERAMAKVRDARSKDRENQTTKEDIKNFSFLWLDYQPRCWWWELVEASRKILLTGVLAVCFSSTSYTPDADIRPCHRRGRRWTEIEIAGASHTNCTFIAKQSSNDITVVREIVVIILVHVHMFTRNVKPGR